MKHRPKFSLLTLEFITLFILIPLALFIFGTRWAIYLTLWGAGLYAFVMLRREPDFSWRRLWHGNDWTRNGKCWAFLRFLFVGILLTLVTYYTLPDKFMRFPLDRFPLWCAVMVLYPLLSIVPQELCFRSFYFMRYNGIVSERWSGVAINGLLFGFSHIILNNNRNRCI